MFDKISFNEIFTQTNSSISSMKQKYVLIRHKSKFVGVHLDKRPNYKSTFKDICSKNDVSREQKIFCGVKKN